MTYTDNTTPDSLTDQIKGHLKNAIEAHRQGDDISWDLGSGMGPQGQLFHFMTILAPSPILGETIQAGGMIMGARDVTGEQVAGMVQQALENIRAERSAKLSQELPPQTNTPTLEIGR